MLRMGGTPRDSITCIYSRGHPRVLFFVYGTKVISNKMWDKNVLLFLLVYL